MFKILSLVLLFAQTTNLFAANSQVAEGPSKEPTNCELLMVDAIKLSQNPELNYKLQAQLRSEAFLKAASSVVDASGNTKTQKELLTMGAFLTQDPSLRASLARVLNKSIVGFDRQGFQSPAYKALGIEEEDGVVYQIQHEGGQVSLIVISRGGDSLDGLNIDTFAAGDIKPGALPGSVVDLSSINVEVYAAEGDVLVGTRHVSMWFDSSKFFKSYRLADQTYTQWEQWWSDRYQDALNRDVQMVPSRNDDSNVLSETEPAR